MSPELYAFWRHDLYPFLLGGSITQFLANGRVETVEFGKGRYFRPVLIVPKEVGVALRNKLRDLEHEYKMAKDQVLEQEQAKLNKLLKEYELTSEEKIDGSL